MITVPFCYMTLPVIEQGCISLTTAMACSTLFLIHSPSLPSLCVSAPTAANFLTMAPLSRSATICARKKGKT